MGGGRWEVVRWEVNDAKHGWWAVFGGTVQYSIHYTLYTIQHTYSTSLAGLRNGEAHNRQHVAPGVLEAVLKELDNARQNRRKRHVGRAALVLNGFVHEGVRYVERHEILRALGRALGHCREVGTAEFDQRREHGRDVAWCMGEGGGGRGGGGGDRRRHG